MIGSELQFPWSHGHAAVRWDGSIEARSHDVRDDCGHTILPHGAAKDIAQAIVIDMINADLTEAIGSVNGREPIVTSKTHPSAESF